MSYCAIDNPATMCFEVWDSGRLVQFVSLAAIYQRASPWRGTRDFVPGRIHAQLGAHPPEVAAALEAA